MVTDRETVQNYGKGTSTSQHTCRHIHVPSLSLASLLTTEGSHACAELYSVLSYGETYSEICHWFGSFLLLLGLLTVELFLYYTMGFCPYVISFDQVSFARTHHMLARCKSLGLVPAQKQTEQYQM